MAEMSALDCISCRRSPPRACCRLRCLGPVRMYGDMSDIRPFRKGRGQRNPNQIAAPAWHSVIPCIRCSPTHDHLLRQPQRGNIVAAQYAHRRAHKCHSGGSLGRVREVGHLRCVPAQYALCGCNLGIPGRSSRLR